jgi:microcin C transport system substrate-binding protein
MEGDPMFGLSASSCLLPVSLSFVLLAPALAWGQGTGTFFDSLNANPSSLIPITNTDYESTVLAGRFLESLLERNWDTYAWEPHLASKWEVSADGKQYTFTLDPAARFWDGSPVTAEDVKFSFDLIFMPGVLSAAAKPALDKVEKAEVLGKDKVRFSVKELYYKNLDVLAGLTIFQKKHYSQLYAKDKTLTKAEVTKDVLGTNQWEIEKWQDSQQVVLKRRENYWAKAKRIQQGRWNVDRYIYKIIQDDSVEFETFRKGELSYLGLTPKQWTLQAKGPEFETRIQKVQAKNLNAKGYSFVGWNNNHPILGNKDVRWALSHLMDIRKWNKRFDFDLTEPTIGPYSPKSEEHDPSLQAVAFDLKEARKRLAAAGWTQAGKDGFLVKDGKSLEITILYPTQAKSSYEPPLTDFKNQAAKVGVKILLKPMEWTSFTKLLDDRNFDAVVLAWTREIDGDLKQIWHSQSEKDKGSNFISYKNPEVDKTIDQHRITLDRAKRVELARKLQKLIYEDQPYSFMSEGKFSLYAHQKNIEKQKDTFPYTIGVNSWKIKP